MHRDVSQMFAPIDCIGTVSTETQSTHLTPRDATSASSQSERAAQVMSGPQAERVSQAFPLSFERDPQDWYGHARAHFESAETDRLNEAHWQWAQDCSINDVLATALPVMRARSNYEAWNNPTLKGLILTHTIAVVGDDGPLLELSAEDKEGDSWCAEAEHVWEEWCKDSDAAGSIPLGTRIKKWNRSCWTNGEWLDQFVIPQVRTPIRLRLHEIEPRRLCSPISSAADPKIVLGIERDEYRRPMRYWIDDGAGWSSKGNWYNASDIMHGWDRAMAEPGQARGCPWAQVGLPVAADLRDYDVQVLDAARAAADMAIIAFTTHPDADFIKDVPTSVAFRRRRINNLAPGWQVAQMQPHHPTATYREHRQERQGDLGRGEGVPSMVTRLDARDHNYSSARFDYGLMFESAKHVRATLYNPSLFVLVSLVLSEAQLSGLLRPRPPRVLVDFVWDAMPQIDDEKASNAEEKYLKIGTMAYSDACAARHGKRMRDVVRKRARDARLLADNQLPSVAEATSKAPATTTGA